jgi:ABC-type multidrug transport system fused ATPase/permease subunit
MTTPAARSSLRSVVWPILRPFRGLLLLAALFNGAHGIALTVQNLTPKWLIDEVLLAPELNSVQRWQRFAWLALAYLVASNIGRMTFWHIGYRIFTWVREQAVLALRAQFFRHVNHLCLRFHGQHSSGELFSYLFGSPLANIMQFYQHTSMSFCGAVVLIISTLATVFCWDPLLGMVLVVTVVSSVLMMNRSRRRVQVITNDFQQTEGKVSGHIADLLRGNKAVKLYAMEEQVAISFEAQALQIGKKSYERDIKSHMEWMKQESFGYFMFVVLMAACTWRYADGKVSPGEVTAVFLSYNALLGPLQQIFQAATLWGSAQAAIARISAVLDVASTTPDPDPRQSAANVPPAGDIAFHHVEFSYGTQPVLRGLDLHIPYGQRIAFVGPSGAGKSTISQLVMRLYDPNAGAVTLAGVDLRRLRGAELRRRFGVVPQDPFIFRTTIRDNVRVARPDADDVAIRRALEQANAWEFVAELPGQLDELVGEGGSSLSGGQRQRLSIARALLADTPFFIFDEATSALDTLSEELIQRTLDTTLRGRTAILIAHRLATVKNCDRIVVLKDGVVVQDGTYDVLVKSPGLFAELVAGQRLRD